MPTNKGGRPPLPQGEKKVQRCIILSPPLWREVDRKRGKQTASQYLAAMLAKLFNSDSQK